MVRIHSVYTGLLSRALARCECIFWNIVEKLANISFLGELRFYVSAALRETASSTVPSTGACGGMLDGE
jgi:hypothetical protein